MRRGRVCLSGIIIMVLLCACSFSDAARLARQTADSLRTKNQEEFPRGLVESIPEDNENPGDFTGQEETDDGKQNPEEDNWQENVRGKVWGKKGQGNSDAVTERENTDTAAEYENPDAAEYEGVKNGNDTESKDAAVAAQNTWTEWKTGNTPLPKNCITQANSFYYSRLSKEDKQVYEEILRGLINLERAVLPATAEDSVDRVFKCVMSDHPEIFYVFGYRCSKEYLGNKLQNICISGTMNIEPEELQQRRNRIEAKAAEILEPIQGIGDAYEITKYLYRYIINNTEYDKHSVDNQNICSVFLNGRSVCSGYAKAFQYLLQKKGIQNGIVNGTVNGGNAHAWNMVLLDGEYYYVDVTWGDSSYNYGGGKASGNGPVPGVLYDYLCVTTAELCKTHQIEALTELPVCVAEKDNYYRREGYYFTTVDENALQQVFRKGYDQKETTVTIKCANDSVYRAMLQYLLEEQKVFNFLQNAGGTVTYVNNGTLGSITFWL